MISNIFIFNIFDKYCINLKCIICLFDTSIYFNMTAIVAIVSTYVTYLSFHICCGNNQDLIIYQVRWL